MSVSKKIKIRKNCFNCQWHKKDLFGNIYCKKIQVCIMFDIAMGFYCIKYKKDMYRKNG
jgi:hypothetical protein